MSQIDSTVIVDGQPVDKEKLRAQLRTANSEVSALQDALGNRPVDTETRMISGGWVAEIVTLGVRVTGATYKILGTEYTSPQTTLTLAAGDATNPRFDLIAFNASGAAVVIQGTPAAAPVRPSADPDLYAHNSQFIFVPANASDLSTTKESIYAENTGNWTASDPAATGRFTLASSANPYAGSVHIRGASLQDGDTVQFLNGSTVNLGDFENVVFHIDPGTIPSGSPYFQLRLFNAGSLVGKQFSLPLNRSSYGYVLDAAGYQKVVVPVSAFEYSGALNRLDVRYRRVGGSGTLDLDIDDVYLVKKAVTATQVKTFTPYVFSLTSPTGDAAVGTDVESFRLQHDFLLEKAVLEARTAPTGASLIAAIKANGTSILTPTIAAAATSGEVATSRLLAKGTLVSFDFTQVGSTVAGAGVKVHLLGDKV